MPDKEYIEREAAIKTVSDWYRKALHPENMSSYNEGERDAYRTALSEIANLPAADVRPVVRGRWIRHYEQADTGEDIIAYPCGWVCSECGRWESEDEPFCNCGAMMEES